MAAVAAAVAVGAAAAWFGWRDAQGQWFYSYLTAWLCWTGITLGSLAILLLHNLTGGAWGVAARPALQASAATLPLVGLLFVPIALSADRIYPWALTSQAALDPLLAHKRPYLNVPAFQVRAAVYFAVWLALGGLVAWQRRHVVEPGSIEERRLKRFSGQGLALHGLAVTFAAIDWTMSLQPHWFSTIYGVIAFSAQGLAALAWATLVTAASSRDDQSPSVRLDAMHDLGKLLLGFLMFWAYVAFSQFLIIWYGNVPEEVAWYVRRTSGGWGAVALAIVVLHFAVPFLILLSRNVKRRASWLGGVAALLLVMHGVDTAWQIQPAAPRTESYKPWLDLGLAIGLGGLWFAFFFSSFRWDAAKSNIAAGRQHG
jgi:hypothetical protein